MTGWCCVLCGASRVVSRARPGGDGVSGPVPGLGNVDAFALRPAVVAAPARTGEHRLPHGRLWHLHLAAFLGVGVGEVERWCADPGSMAPGRTRAVAAATGLPLAMLRPQADGGVTPDGVVAAGALPSRPGAVP